MVGKPKFEEMRCMLWLSKKKDSDIRELVRTRKKRLNQLTNYCRVQCAPFIPKKNKAFKCLNCQRLCTENDTVMHSSVPACSACISGAILMNEKIETYAKSLLNNCLELLEGADTVCVVDGTTDLEPAEFLPPIMRVKRKSRHGVEGVAHKDCFVCNMLSLCARAQQTGNMDEFNIFLEKQDVPSFFFAATVKTAKAKDELKRILALPKILTMKRGRFKPLPPSTHVAVRYAACVRYHLSEVQRSLLRRVRGPNRPAVCDPGDLSIQSMLACALKNFRRLYLQIVNEGKVLFFDVKYPHRNLCLRPNGSEQNLADRLLMKWIQSNDYGVELSPLADKFTNLNLKNGLPMDGGIEPSFGGPETTQQYIIDRRKIKKNLDKMPSYVAIGANGKHIGFYPTFFSCIGRRKSTKTGADISKNTSNVSLLDFLVKTIAQLEDFLQPNAVKHPKILSKVGYKRRHGQI